MIVIIGNDIYILGSLHGAKTAFFDSRFCGFQGVFLNE
jgi:hypothetical protein